MTFRFHLISRDSIWLGLALLTGLVLASLPPLPALALVSSLIILFLCYLEPIFALFLMLCLAPLKTLIETEAPLPLPLDVGQWLLVFFIGLWGVRFVADGHKKLYLPRFGIIGLLIFIWTASLSLLTAQAIPTVLTELLKWVEMLFLVVIIANLPRLRWEWVVFGVILSGVLQGVLGVWQFQGGSGAAHLWILDYRFFRAFGTFGQPNPFGAFMGMVLPLALGTTFGYWVAGWENLSNRYSTWMIGLLYAGMTAILLLGLLTSWSRGAWLGFLVASTSVVWLLPRQRWQGTLLIGIGGFVFLLLLNLGLIPPSIMARLTGFGQDLAGFQDVRGVIISDANFAVIERLAHWQAALRMAESSPWLGVGFGNYETVYPQYALIDWQFALGHAHNYYLNLLAEVGLVGLLGYLVLWSMILGGTLQTLSNKGINWQERGVIAGLMGTWVHISVHSFLDKLYVNNLFLHIGVMLGIVALLQCQTEKDIRT